MMVNNSTNMNNTYNQFSPQFIEDKKTYDVENLGPVVKPDNGIPSHCHWCTGSYLQYS